MLLIQIAAIRLAIGFANANANPVVGLKSVLELNWRVSRASLGVQIRNPGLFEYSAKEFKIKFEC